MPSPFCLNNYQNDTDEGPMDPLTKKAGIVFFKPASSKDETTICLLMINDEADRIDHDRFYNRCFHLSAQRNMKKPAHAIRTTAPLFRAAVMSVVPPHDSFMYFCAACSIPVIPVSPTA